MENLLVNKSEDEDPQRVLKSNLQLPYCTKMKFSISGFLQ